MAYWYAIYTRSRWEKKVADALQKKRLEHYCPMNKVSLGWSMADKRKAVYQPVFANYVFVRTSEAELQTLKRMDGVINVVYWRDKPAVIRDIEIDMMRRFLNEHASIALQKTTVNTSEIVKLINCVPEDNEQGEETEHMVKLYLPSLGYILEAEIAKEMEIRLQPGTKPFSTSLAKFG